MRLYKASKAEIVKGLDSKGLVFFICSAMACSRFIQQKGN